MSSRFLIVAPIAVIVTVALFFLMRDLIDAPAEKPDEAPSETVKFLPEIEDSKSEPKKRHIEPPKVDEPTQAAAPDHNAVRSTMSTDPTITDPDGIDIPTGGGGEKPRIDDMDGSATPLVRGEPHYPQCGRGTGEVVLDFRVEPDGSVGDLNVVSATSSCFAKAARRAALRWRYRPRVVDGEAVPSGRQRVRLVFVEDR